MAGAALLLALAPLSEGAPAENPQPARAGTPPHSHVQSSDEIDETQGPVLIEASYTADAMSNVSGGVRRGARYLDNLDLVLEADLEQVVGWRGAELHLYGLYNNGTSIAALTGDAQVVSNIETGVQALRLYEAWIEQKIVPEFSLRVGLYDLNSEFDALETAGLFVSSPHGIGTDIAQTGLNGPSIFPATSLAARVAIEPVPGWTVRAAILDGVPGDPLHPGRTAIDLGSGDGALMIGELEAPVLGGKLLLGHWRYSARFDTLEGGRGKGNAGVYLRGETALLEHGEQRVDGFFRIGTAAGRFNMFGRFVSTGVKLTGWIPGRADDEIGLAVAAAFTSSDYRLSSSAAGAEVAFEASWRTKAASWLSLQPNVQYVRNPSADPSISHAVILGLRSEISFRLVE